MEQVLFLKIKLALNSLALIEMAKNTAMAFIFLRMALNMKVSNFNDKIFFIQIIKTYLIKGKFKNDKFNGKGTITNADNDKYIGEFKDGVKSGKGTTYN